MSTHLNTEIIDKEGFLRQIANGLGLSFSAEVFTKRSPLMRCRGGMLMINPTVRSLVELRDLMDVPDSELIQAASRTIGLVKAIIRRYCWKVKPNFEMIRSWVDLKNLSRVQKVVDLWYTLYGVGHEKKDDPDLFLAAEIVLSEMLALAKPVPYHSLVRFN